MRSTADDVSKEVEEPDPPSDSVEASKDETGDEDGVEGPREGDSIAPLSSLTAVIESREFSAEMAEAWRSFVEDIVESWLSVCSDARDAGASEAPSAEDDAVLSSVPVSLRSSAW